MENVFVITLDREWLWFGARPLICDLGEAFGGAGNSAGYGAQGDEDAHEHANGQKTSKEENDG
jgi:hypothetical protein